MNTNNPATLSEKNNF